MLKLPSRKNPFQSFAEERLKPLNSKEITFNILGTLIVVLLFNGLANGFFIYLISQRSFFLASHKWNLLNHLEEPIDWLVLGDSSCNQGVIPEILSRELGGTTLNLCIFGPLLVFNDAWMLEQHIRQVGPPKNVIIIHVYDLWERNIGEETFVHLSRIPMSPATLQSFTPSLDLNIGHRLQWFSLRFFHLYTSNDTIADFLQRPEKTFRESREFTVTPSGFMPKYNPNPLDVEEDFTEHLDVIKDKTFEISEINQQSLKAIQFLAEKHEFDVYFVSSPLYEELYDRPQFRRYIRKVRQGLKKFTQSSDRLHLVMDKPFIFDKYQMENVDHLIESAAKIYTQQVAEQIRQEAAKPLDIPKPPSQPEEIN